MRPLALLLAIVTVFIVIGCGTTPSAPSKAASHALDSENHSAASDLLDPKGNVVFYVSNQSIVASFVDIQVVIDGETVVKDGFDFGNGHSWKKFGLKLQPGRHTFIASSIKGKASIKKSFIVKGKHWISLDYWYNTAEYGMAYPAKFTWIMQDEPIGFM
jgi:hypothetical protein